MQVSTWQTVSSPLPPSPPTSLELPAEFGENSNCGTTRTPLWRRSPQGATICNACGLYLKARNSQRPTNLKRPPTVVAATISRKSPEHSSPKSCGQANAATYVAADQTTTGSCPGGGRCNGTGGAEGCSGCPAFNNRVAKSAQLTTLQNQEASNQGSSVDNGPQPIDVAAQETQNPGQNTTVVIACQNCGTTVTPLWRRDESGHTICNACGMCLSSGLIRGGGHVRILTVALL
jgi:GATA-binding protein, other eukaryote